MPGEVTVGLSNTLAGNLRDAHAIAAVNFDDLSSGDHFVVNYDIDRFAGFLVEVDNRPNG